MAKILVLDDNDDFRDVLCELLKRSGYEVCSVGSGNAALAEAKRQKFDLMISDIVMPEKDGIDVMLEMKKDHPDLKVIAISGGGRGRAEDYLGISNMLTSVKCTFKKPFNNESLLKAVKEILGE